MKVLIVVDMQKDFIDGVLGTPEAVAIVDAVSKRIKNSQGELILFTQDTHQDNYLDTPEGKKLPIIHCVENTDGWQLNEAVLKAWRGNPHTIIIQELADNNFIKGQFASLDLLRFLVNRATEISEIEIIGICTDICVIMNSLMLKSVFTEIKISVNAACCAGTTPQSHQEALNIMEKCHIDII